MPAPAVVGTATTDNSTNTTGNTVSLAVPTGTTAGDLLIVHIYAENNAALNVVATGFTLIRSQVHPTEVHTQHVLWKRATSSETGPYVFGWTGNAWRKASCVRVQGALAAGDPINVSTGANTASPGTASPAVSLTTTVAECLLMWGATSYDGSARAVATGGTGTWVEHADLSNLAVDSKAQTATGATGSVAGTLGISDHQTATLIAIRPVTAAVNASADPASTSAEAQDASPSVRTTAEVASVGVTAADAGPSPAMVLDIGPGPTDNHFKLQVGESGQPSQTDVSQADLIAGYHQRPYFYTNAAGTAVVFHSPIDGAFSSEAAGGARTELRETLADGTEIAFDALTGTHVMHGRTAVPHLPPVNPAAVFAQLHNGTTDRIAIRTQLITGVTRLLCRVNGSSTGLTRFSENYDGSEFEWKIEVLAAGAVKVYYNDMVTPIIDLPSGTLVSTGQTWYFKTGVYNQSTTDASNEYSQVTVRDLWVTHTAGAPSASDAAVPVVAQDPGPRVSSSTSEAAIPVAAQTATALSQSSAATVAAEVPVAANQPTVSISKSAATDSTLVPVVGNDAAAHQTISRAAESAAIPVVGGNATVTSSANAPTTATAVVITGNDATTTASGDATAESAVVAVTAPNAAMNAASNTEAPAATADVSVVGGNAGGSASATPPEAALGATALDASVSSTSTTQAVATSALVTVATDDANETVSSTSSTAGTGVTANDASSVTGSQTFGAAEAALVAVPALDASEAITSTAETVFLPVVAYQAAASTSTFRFANADTASVGFVATAVQLSLATTAEPVALAFTVSQPGLSVSELVPASSALVAVAVDNPAATVGFRASADLATVGVAVSDPGPHVASSLSAAVVAVATLIGVVEVPAAIGFMDKLPTRRPTMQSARPTPAIMYSARPSVSMR